MIDFAADAVERRFLLTSNGNIELCQSKILCCMVKYEWDVNVT